MRAISTVLDASLCLLLVTASALTLAGTPTARRTNPGPDTADEIAEVLATSTARVSDANTSIHDTLAGLLATAARMDARRSFSDFPRTVTTRVAHELRRPDVGVQVVARWRPKSTNSRPDPGSTAEGRVVAGETPPPDADVHAASLEVRQAKLTVRTWSE